MGTIAMVPILSFAPPMRHFFLISFLLLSFSLSAQDRMKLNPDGRKVKRLTATQMVPTGNDMNLVEIWYYNAKGEPDSVSKQGFGGMKTYAYSVDDNKTTHRWNEDRTVDSVFHLNDLQKIQHFDADGDMTEYHIFGTSTGNVLSSGYYVYSKPHVRKMSKTYYYSSSSTLNKMTYIWFDKKGNTVKTQNYTPDERLTISSRYKYDKHGNQIKEVTIHYDEDGKAESKKTIEHRFQYDQEGNWIRCDVLYDGSLKYYTTRTIEYR